jgi:hypothetical protein
MTVATQLGHEKFAVNFHGLDFISVRHRSREVALGMMDQEMRKT